MLKWLPIKTGCFGFLYLLGDVNKVLCVVNLTCLLDITVQAPNLPLVQRQ